jgi:hypothetical protein
MWTGDGEVVFHNIELHKRELIRQAKMERLARQAQGEPSSVKSGWLRSTTNFLSAAITKVKPQAVAGLKNGAMLITPQDNGLETI